MSRHQLHFACDLPDGVETLLVPGGLVTPQARCYAVTADSGRLTPIHEETTGQTAYRLDGAGARVVLTFQLEPGVDATYPETMLTPHPSRFTRFADDLVQDVPRQTRNAVGCDPHRR